MKKRIIYESTLKWQKSLHEQQHLLPQDFWAEEDAEPSVLDVPDPRTVDNNPVNVAHERLAKRTDHDKSGRLVPIISDWECVAHKAAKFIKDI